MLIIVALYHSLKSGNVMPPTLLFPKVSLTMWALLGLCMHFRISYSSSEKNATGILIGIVESVYCFG